VDEKHLSDKQQMRPAIIAAYATAIDRSDRGGGEVSELWEEVWQHGLPPTPLRRARAQLRSRAAAGRLK